MVPSLPTQLARWLAFAVNAVIFLIHFVIHLLSISCNPADDNVLVKYAGKSPRTLRAFDRSKHSHVIENQFCYICEVTVKPKSKHCR